MTYELITMIEELRRELGDCDPAERAQIKAELEQAEAELAVLVAEQEDRVGSEPPF